MYGKQADEYRVLTTVSLIRRAHGRKQDMLSKLKAVPSVLDRLKWTPQVEVMGDPCHTGSR